MAKKSVDEPQEILPTFDYSNISRKWGKRFARVQVEMAQRAFIISGTPVDGLSDKELAKVNAGKIESANAMFELEDERDQLLIQVLKSVPQDWLVDGAPTDLTWESVDDLDWLRNNRFDELAELANNSRKESSKN